MKKIIIASLIGTTLVLTSCGAQKEEVISSIPSPTEQKIQTGTSIASSGFASMPENLKPENKNTEEVLSVVVISDKDSQKIKWAFQKKYPDWGDAKMKDKMYIEATKLVDNKFFEGMVLYSGIENISTPRFLAVKENSEWKIVSPGGDIPLCSWVDPYDFPVSMVPECLSEDNAFIKRKNHVTDKDGDKITQTESVFSDTQIKEILVKISENDKKQQEQEKSATGILIQDDFRAEYLPSKNNTDDKIRIITGGKEKLIPFVYNESNQKLLKSCDYTVKNECSFTKREFQWFLQFSPSGTYLLYEDNWTNGYLVDVNSWKLILQTITQPVVYLWTEDKKQFIYGWVAGETSGWLFITKKWLFPEVQNIIEESTDINGVYLDEKNIYALVFKVDKKYLKIIDLNSLKEVFSKEIE